MSATRLQENYETGGNHLKPFLAAVTIFVVCVALAVSVTGLP
jgi:hypothetical protein